MTGLAVNVRSVERLRTDPVTEATLLGLIVGVSVAESDTVLLLLPLTLVLSDAETDGDTEPDKDADDDVPVETLAVGKRVFVAETASD